MKNEIWKIEVRESRKLKGSKPNQRKKKKGSGSKPARTKLMNPPKRNRPHSASSWALLGAAAAGGKHTELLFVVPEDHDEKEEKGKKKARIRQRSQIS